MKVQGHLTRRNCVALRARLKNKFTRNEPPRDADRTDPLDAVEQAAVIACACDAQLANLWQLMFWTGAKTRECPSPQSISDTPHVCVDDAFGG